MAMAKYFPSQTETTRDFMCQCLGDKRLLRGGDVGKGKHSKKCLKSIICNTELVSSHS